MPIFISLILSVWTVLTVLSSGAFAQDVKGPDHVLNQTNTESTVAIEVDAIGGRPRNDLKRGAVIFESYGVAPCGEREGVVIGGGEVQAGIYPELVAGDKVNWERAQSADQRRGEPSSILTF